MQLCFVPITTYCIEDEQQSLSKANIIIYVFLSCITLKRKLQNCMFRELALRISQKVITEIIQLYRYAFPIC